MTGSKAPRPAKSDPGGIQARADGHQVEVRDFGGELIRIVTSSVAADMVRARLAGDLQHCLRLKLGIRWLPTRFDRPSGRPDLNQIERGEPGRYAALWRGTRDARTGKGALGRRTVDSAVAFRHARGPHEAWIAADPASASQPRAHRVSSAPRCFLATTILE